MPVVVLLIEIIANAHRKILLQLFFFPLTIMDLSLGDKENDSGDRKLCDSFKGEEGGW